MHLMQYIFNTYNHNKDVKPLENDSKHFVLVLQNHFYPSHFGSTLVYFRQEHTSLHCVVPRSVINVHVIISFFAEIIVVYNDRHD